MNTLPAANLLWPAPTATSHASASRPMPAAPAGPKEPAGGAESAAGVAAAAWCLPIPQATPKWRLGPDPVPLQRGPAGSAWPPGGKGLPPQLPQLPLPLPRGTPGLDAEALANGAGACMPLPAQTPKWRLPPTAAPLTLAPGVEPLAAGDKNQPPQLPQLPVMPMPIAGPDAEPSKLAQALAALKGKDSPVSNLPATPIPGLGVKGGDVPARLPLEIFGGSPLPTLPVIPGHRPVDRLAREPGMGRKPGAAPGLSVVRSVPAPQDLRVATGEAASAAPGTVPEQAPASEVTRSVDTVAQLSHEPDTAIASAAANGAAAARSAQSAPPAAATMQGYLPHLVGSDEWIEAVAERVGQMTDGSHGRANLRLNPAQLGPMQIEVHVEGDRAIVSLAVRHDATGDALERAMPNLRAQLADSGFASVDVSISRHPQREHAGTGDPYAGAALHADEEMLPAASRPLATAVSRLLDAYA